MSEFGHADKLLSEFDQRDIKDGGYKETSRLWAFMTALSSEINNEDSAEKGLTIVEDDAVPLNPQEEVGGDHH